MRKYKEHKKKDNGKSQWKPGFILQNGPDGIIETLNFADTDFFPNIRKLLILGATSAIALTEVEKPTSGIKRLKTPYLSTVSDKRESDLLHLH